MNFSRLTRTRAAGVLSSRSRLGIRSYAVRRAEDSPFDYLPKNIKKPFFNWKAIGILAGLGSYLAYSEIILDKYAEFTDIKQDDELLPIQLSYRMTQLPIYQKINHTSDDEWTRLETWEDLDHNIMDHQKLKKHQKDEKEASLVSQSLAKPGGFLIKPVIFHNKKTNEGVTIVHAGYRLCGYPFIIHGGVLATVLNETYKRNAALSTDTSSGYKGDFKVENLSILYKYPSFANQFLIVKTKKVPMEGENDKLVKFESIIESESGKVLVKSEAVVHDTGRYTKSLGLNLKSYIGL